MNRSSQPQGALSPSGRAVAGFIALLLLAPLAVPGAAAAEESVRFIVGFHQLPRDLDAGDPYAGGRVFRTDAGLQAAVVTTTDPAGFATRASADPNVAYVEVDEYRQWIQLVPNDPQYSSMYGPQHVRAPEVWDFTLGDMDRNVCIVDTGVRYTHEDLAGSRWLGGYDYVNSDADPWDDQGHGTHVAGSAAASVNNGKGVAGMGNVGVKGVKVLSSSGSGYTSDVASGISWCADNAGHVVSLSLGGGGSTTLRNAVDYAWGKGALVVAAAGNDGPCSNCILYPAAYPNSIAVGCTTSSKAQCYFSNSGPELALAAPGYDIVSTCYTSNTAYCTKSGTSMAAPHASGVATLLWSYAPSMTNGELRTLLQSTAKDLGSAGRDTAYGYGLVDAANAFAALAPDLPLAPVLNETFDDGVANGFSLTGFWHVASNCVTARSAPSHLGYHRTGACDYDTTLTRNSGTATVTVNLTDAIVASLKYYQRWQTEQSSTAVDVRTLSVSADGGATWTTLRQWDARDANLAAWTPFEVSLNPYVGKVVSIRFSFDTMDGVDNLHPGWYIDDLQVLAASNYPPVARAGADITAGDADGDGMATVILNGTASTDSDGTIASATWTLGGATLATGLVANATLPIGVHAIKLTVTDDEGATANDTLVATVVANRAPVANAGPDLTAGDADGDGIAVVTLNGAASSDPDGVLVSHEWLNGATPLATGVSPQVNLAPGTHVVTLRVTDQGGLSATDNVTVTVVANRAPTARFVTACQARSCTFDATLSTDPDGAIASYEWEFGDNSTGAGVTTAHTFAVSGTYQVRLTVVDQGGMRGSMISTIVTSTLGVLDENFDDGVADGFTVSGLWHVSSLCAPAPPSAPNYLGYHRTTACDFNAGTTSGSATVRVDLTNSTSATLSFDHRYQTESSSGTYDIRRVEAKLATSSTWTTLQQWDSRNASQTAWTAYQRSLDAYAGNRIDIRFFFNSVDGTANSYLGWHIDNVRVTGTFDGTPVARAGADQTLADADGTGSEPVQLDGSTSYDRDGSVVSYEWSTGGVALATGARANVSLPVGTSVVLLTITDDNGLAATDSLVVVVNANRAPVARAGSDQDLFDTNADGFEAATLDAGGSTDADGAIVAYSWSENGVELSTLRAPRLVLPVGLHTLTLQVTDNGNAIANDTVVVSVAANRPPIARAGDDVTRVDADGTGFETVALLDNGSRDQDGSLVGHVWLDGDTVIGTTPNVTHAFSVGVHVVALEVTDNGGAVSRDERIVTVVANAPPAAVANVTCRDLQCTFDATGSGDLEGPLASLAWTFGDGKTSTSLVATHMYPIDGTYEWTLTVRDGGNATASLAGSVKLIEETPRSAPSAPPRDVHSLDTESSTSPASRVGALDVQSAWFESDVRRLYVGMKLRDLEATSDVDTLYAVDFRFTWPVTDPTWGGTVPGGSIARLRAAAVETPAGTTFELRGLYANGTSVRIAQVLGTADADTDILWWTLPRAAMQNPADGAIVRDAIASSALTVAGTAVPNSGDSTDVAAPFALGYTVRRAEVVTTHTFDASSEGFVKERDQSLAHVGWDPATGSILVQTNRADFEDEILAKSLGRSLNQSTSFAASAEYRVLHQGNGQSASILFLTRASSTSPKTELGTIRFGYDSRDGATRQDPQYVMEYRDLGGMYRIRQAVSVPAPTPVVVSADYDASTRLLTMRVTTLGGGVLGSANYTLGTNPNDGFRMEKVGVAADGQRSPVSVPHVGQVDDIVLRLPPAGAVAGIAEPESDAPVAPVPPEAPVRAMLLAPRLEADVTSRDE